jgi:hypothetical protein
MRVLYFGVRARQPRLLNIPVSPPIDDGWNIVYEVYYEMTNHRKSAENVYCSYLTPTHYIVGCMDSSGEMNLAMKSLGLDSCWTGPAVILRTDGGDIDPTELFGRGWRRGLGGRCGVGAPIAPLTRPVFPRCVNRYDDITPHPLRDAASAGFFQCGCAAEEEPTAAGDDERATTSAATSDPLPPAPLITNPASLQHNSDE